MKREEKAGPRGPLKRLKKRKRDSDESDAHSDDDFVEELGEDEEISDEAELSEHSDDIEDLAQPKAAAQPKPTKIKPDPTHTPIKSEGKVFIHPKSYHNFSDDDTTKIRQLLLSWYDEVRKLGSAGTQNQFSLTEIPFVAEPT